MTLRDIPFADAGDVGSIRYRLAPIDVGYDLRGEGVAIAIGPEDPLRVSYADDDGERRVLEGPRAAVLARLCDLGYRIVEAPDAR